METLGLGRGEQAMMETGYGEGEISHGGDHGSGEGKQAMMETRGTSHNGYTGSGEEGTSHDGDPGSGEEGASHDGDPGSHGCPQAPPPTHTHTSNKVKEFSITRTYESLLLPPPPPPPPPPIVVFGCQMAPPPLPYPGHPPFQKCWGFPWV